MNKYMKSVVSALKHWVTSQKSDWNQNDPTAANFVKNRPFYESIEVLFDQSVEIGESNPVWQIEQALPISTGDSVDVTFNGTKYELIAQLVPGESNIVYFGNDAMFGGLDNGIPFCGVTGYDGGTESFLIIAPDFVGQTVSVKVEGKTVKKIDPKFLPEMSSYCHVNIWYDENADGYSSDKTYNDIKAAEAAKIPIIGTLTIPNGNVYTLVGCDFAVPSTYLVAFDLYDLPTTLKVFCASIDENNIVNVIASNFSGARTDV